VRLRQRLTTHWAGTTDARPLALFRILFGLTLLADILDRLADFRAFYTDEGILPRALLPTVLGHVRLPWLMGTPLASGLVFAVGIAAALAFIAGFHARVAATALWLFESTLCLRNDFVCDGGDLVMTVLAFWSIFADLDAAWSVRPGPRRLARALPQRLLELQVVLIYLCAGLAKTGASWRHGDAIFFALQLNNLSRPLGMTLLRSAAACRLLTFSTMAIELSYAPLVLAPGISRVTRPLAALEARLQREPPVAAPPSPSRARQIVSALFVAQLALVALSLTSLRLPNVLRRELFFAGLSQDWTMFSPEVAREDGFFTGHGTLDDGRAIDPLPLAAPRMLPQTSQYSRWFKLRENLASDGRVQAMVLRYLCARVDGLHDLTLTYHRRLTRAPGEDSRPFSVAATFSRRCARQ
jgi:hypothetical protein